MAHVRVCCVDCGSGWGEALFETIMEFYILFRWQREENKKQRCLLRTRKIFKDGEVSVCLCRGDDEAAWRGWRMA